MDFPYSVYVYQAAFRPGDDAFWIEAVRTSTEQWAVYVTGLLHTAGVPHADTIQQSPVVKAIRYGIAFLCLPDEHTVELCEKVIAKQERRPKSLPWDEPL
jgi:hypothetical protein